MRKLTIPSIFTAVDKFSGPVDKMSKNASASFHRMDRNMRKMSKRYGDMSKKSAIASAAIIAPLGLLANEAVKFEDKMADVAKTTGLAGSNLISLGDDIRKMSENTRTGVSDLVKIAEIGGQLGVTEGLREFIDSADKFNVALGGDFSGGVEEAVSQVGKIKNLFEETRGLKIDEVITRAGSAINTLGSKGAGTSANITDFILRLGAMPDALKPSIQGTAALGTFLEEVGITSERGASGLSKLLLVASRDMGGFAKQMKITQKEAKVLLQNDPTEFTKRFSETFKGLEPDKLGKKLKSLGVNSQEAIKVVGALGSNTKRLTELQGYSNKAFKDGTSLLEEFNTKNNTTAARMAKVKNQFLSLSVDLGNVLIPVINDLMTSLMPVIKGFASWARDNKGTVALIAKLALGIGVLTGAFSLVTGAISLGAKAMGLLNTAFFMSPIGWVVAGIAAIATASYFLYKEITKVSDAQQLQNDVLEKAKERSLDQRVEVALLFKTLNKAKIGTDEYTDAVSKLEQMQPGITKQYNLQSEALRDLDGAQKSLMGNLMKLAKEEVMAEMMKDKMRSAMDRQDKGVTLMDKAIAFSNFGFGVSGEDIMNLEINKLNKEAGMLGSQLAESKLQTANPVKAQNTATNETIKQTTENVVLDFINMPSFMKVSSSKKGDLKQPSTGSTKQN